MAMSWSKLGRYFYIATYVGLILGIAVSLLVTGYDLVQQTLAFAQGGGRYFYIFILVGAYIATVGRRYLKSLISRVYFLASLPWRGY